MSDLLFGLDKKTNKYKPMSLTTTADKILMDLDKNTLLSTEFKTLKDKVSEIGTKVADIPSSTEMNKFIKEGENKIVRVNSCTQAISPNIIYLIPSTDPQAPADIKKINRSNVFYYIKVDHISNDEGGIVGLQYAWINGDMSNWFESDSSYKVRTYSRGFHYYSSYQFTPWRLNAIPIENYVTTFFKGKGTFEYAFGREDITNADNANKPNTMYFLKRGATNSPFPEDDGFIQLEAWNEDGKSYRQIAYSNKSAKRYIRIYRDDAASINWNNGNKYTNWIEDDPSATYVKYFPRNSCTKEFLNDLKVKFNYQTTLTTAKDFIGAPYDWCFLNHYGNPEANGYATQILIRLNGDISNVTNGVFGGWNMLIRTSNANKWTTWGPIHSRHNLLSYLPITSDSDINKLADSTKYYASRGIYSTAVPERFGTHQDTSNGYTWIDWHRKESDNDWQPNSPLKSWGVQWFSGWNHVGLWHREIRDNTPTSWKQFVMGNSDRNFQRVYIHNKYNQGDGSVGPVIDLAVGDHDTGLNNSADNCMDIVAAGHVTLSTSAAYGALIPAYSPSNNEHNLQGPRIRNTVISPNDPNLGANGDIWLKYV